MRRRRRPPVQIEAPSFGCCRGSEKIRSMLTSSKPARMHHECRSVLFRMNGCASKSEDRRREMIVCRHFKRLMPASQKFSASAHRQCGIRFQRDFCVRMDGKFRRKFFENFFRHGRCQERRCSPPKKTFDMHHQIKFLSLKIDFHDRGRPKKRAIIVFAIDLDPTEPQAPMNKSRSKCTYLAKGILNL